jgi:hypothetical protein
MTARKENLPHDAIRLDAFYHRGFIIVCGQPPVDVAEDSPDYHNCDAMGCGCDHVLARIQIHPLTAARLAWRPADREL